MYASDNSDKLMDPTSWVSGNMDWGSGQNNTNAALMLNQAALIAPYVKSAALFKCPSDNYQSPLNLGPRIRSVSLDGALGINPSFGSNYKGRSYFSARKMSDLNTPGPANIYVILDEHPDSINDGAFMLDAGHWSSTTEHWRDFPGSLHNNALSISFADGHSEIHRWVEGRTCQVVEYKSFSTGGGNSTTPLNQGVNLTKSPDYEWLEDRMPYR
jgi:prepilin-type processing-associated H-X9-DG protein